MTPQRPYIHTCIHTYIHTHLLQHSCIIEAITTWHPSGTNGRLVCPTLGFATARSTLSTFSPWYGSLREKASYNVIPNAYTSVSFVACVSPLSCEYVYVYVYIYIYIYIHKSASMCMCMRLSMDLQEKKPHIMLFQTHIRQSLLLRVFQSSAVSMCMCRYVRMYTCT